MPRDLPADQLEALTQDVRELKQVLARRDAELASLHESEHLFRTLVESAKDFIFVLDRDGTVRYVNDFGAKAMGRRREECVGQSHTALFPAAAGRQREHVQQVFETGQPVWVETKTDFPSGSLYLDTWLVPVWSLHGEVEMVLGVSRDISARVEALQALEQRITFEETIAAVSRRFINLPIDQIDGAIREGLRVLGTFIGADRASVRLFMDGGSRIDIAYEWQHPDVKGVHSAETTSVVQMPWGIKALQALEPVLLASVEDLPPEAHAERDLLRSLGLVSLAVVPLVYGGSLVGVLTFTSVRDEKHWSKDTVALLAIAGEVFANALARKRTEEELSKLAGELERVERIESIGILAGGIAHDFNNILAAIWGNLSLARTTLEAESMAYARLAEAEKALTRAKDLTQQLLTFAKGGSPVKQLVELGELVEESCAFATTGANVRPVTRVAQALWPVEADRGQISQVLHNLVINAVQAMPNGGMVEVVAENVAVAPELGLPLPAGPYVRIKVRDQGAGIAAEHLPKLFVPYFTTKRGGSGLGLATSYNIVRKHAGLITIESVVGTGSTFSVYLPAAPGVHVAARADDASIMRGTGRVLVVDDEEGVRQSASEMLRYLGYEPECASDGQEGLERYAEASAQSRAFAAVIMDLTIPGGMGGREAISRMLAMDPQARAIVSSGYSNDPVMADYLRFGFRGVLRKPYGIRELGAALHSLLAKR